MSSLREALLSLLKGTPVELVDELRVKNQHLSEEIEKTKAQVQSLLTDQEEAAQQSLRQQSQLEDMKAAKTAADEESELLLLQLHQVQEELEECFVKWQKETEENKLAVEDRNLLDLRLSQVLEELEYQFELHQDAKSLIEEYASTIEQSKTLLLALMRSRVPTRAAPESGAYTPTPQAEERPTEADANATDQEFGLV